MYRCGICIFFFFIFFKIYSYTVATYSGFRYEKPTNSVWSKFIINTLSVGVKSVFSDVNCLSKLDTSLRCFYWKEKYSIHWTWVDFVFWFLTIFGLNGGCTSRFSIFSQSIRRKKGCKRTSSSPVGPHPNRFDGCFVRNWNDSDLLREGCIRILYHRKRKT